eukprot:scaffold1463_cov189-Ochromonas_danica.AAC.3
MMMIMIVVGFIPRPGYLGVRLNRAIVGLSCSATPESDTAQEGQATATATAPSTASPESAVIEEQQQVVEEEVTSHEIRRLLHKIVELHKQKDSVEKEIAEDRIQLQKLDEEYGGEIARIKKEFARIRERSYEEAIDVSNKAKIDALKEVLPITDNYFRAKGAFLPPESENEEKIHAVYDEIFQSFSKIIEGFGVTRVESVGQPFDFNTMEAIMTAPSTEYAKDLVCKEYQVGYKMGNKCVRPALVVVSMGPGPSAPVAN